MSDIGRVTLITFLFFLFCDDWLKYWSLVVFVQLAAAEEEELVLAHAQVLAAAEGAREREDAASVDAANLARGVLPVS